MNDKPTPPMNYILYQAKLGEILPAKCLFWEPKLMSWWPLEIEAVAQPGYIYSVPEVCPSPITYTSASDSPSKPLLHEAHDLVHGDRQQSYGDAYQSFERIASFWHTYLKDKLKDTEHITPKDVASMMILMKVSRSVTSTKRDNWVDIAGYSSLAADIEAHETDPE